MNEHNPHMSCCYYFSIAFKLVLVRAIVCHSHLDTYAVVRFFNVLINLIGTRRAHHGRLNYSANYTLTPLRMRRHPSYTRCINFHARAAHLVYTCPNRFLTQLGFAME